MQKGFIQNRVSGNVYSTDFPWSMLWYAVKYLRSLQTYLHHQYADCSICGTSLHFVSVTWMSVFGSVVCSLFHLSVWLQPFSVLNAPPPPTCCIDFGAHLIYKRLSF